MAHGNLFWRKRECGLELEVGLQRVQVAYLFDVGFSCSLSSRLHIVVVVVVVATVVVLRSQSSSLSPPCGRRGRGNCRAIRGWVVAASLHRSSSSLPLPPRIDMVVVVVVITSESLRSQRSGRRGSSSRCRCPHDGSSSSTVFSSSLPPNRPKSSKLRKKTMN
ncbi:hypothetical protein EDB85DRAFT_1936287 [Lactarius pseudohatsudake]|nr:hypothetical protein EDB85DRAFT_1936287 [Lactarius pseudohatsudake]